MSMYVCECMYTLVCFACTWMGGVFAAVQCRVTHAAVVGVHINLSSHATGLTIVCACLHLLPHLQVLLHSYGEENKQEKKEILTQLSCLQVTIENLCKSQSLHKAATAAGTHSYCGDVTQPSAPSPASWCQGVCHRCRPCLLEASAQPDAGWWGSGRLCK